MHFTNDALFEVVAEAHADGGDYATAAATLIAGISQSASAGSAGAGDLSVNNSGEIFIGALAEATGEIAAYATAAIMGGVLQTVTGSGGSIDFNNSGTLEVVAVANADAMGGEEADIAYKPRSRSVISRNGPYTTIPTGTGTTSGYGDRDHGYDGGSRSAAIDMTNDDDSRRRGRARIRRGNAYAFATALRDGGQATAAGDVDVSLVNHDELRVMAKATAVGGHAGTAIAQAVGGTVAAANATGTGDATVSVENSGEIIVRADAHAAKFNAWAGAHSRRWQVARGPGRRRST